MNSRQLSVAAVIGTGLLALAAPRPANASPVDPNGSVAGALIGSSTTTTTGSWNIGTGTTLITIGSTPSVTGLVTTDADPYLGVPNNLLTGNGGSIGLGATTTMSTNSFAVASGAITPFTVTVGTYTFDYSSEVVTSRTDGNIGLAFLGYLAADTSNELITGPSISADLSLTFTESSPTGAIGLAFSLDSPPNAELVPEPASMIILGSGLLGLGLFRRRA